MRASNDKNEVCPTEGSVSGQPGCTDAPNGWQTIDLLTNAEGRILLVGVALTLSFLGWLAFKVMTSPAQSHALLVLSVLTATAGRPAAIIFGYSAKLPRPIIFGIPATVETAVVLVFYPLIAFSCQHLLVVKPLQNAFHRLLETAETHRSTIRRYGPIGLFAIVLVIPYGPLIGAVIGFLLRMPVWLNMTTVLTATYVATLVWAVIGRHLQDRVSCYGPYATTILVVAVIAIALVGHVIRRAIRERKHKS